MARGDVTVFEEAKAKMRKPRVWNAETRGRPKTHTGEMVRGSFRVPVETVASLRKIGDGNVCRAIVRLVQMWEVNHQ